MAGLRENTLVRLDQILEPLILKKSKSVMQLLDVSFRIIWF